MDFSWVNDILGWLLDLPGRVLAWFLGLLVDLYLLIPVPGWLSSAQSHLSGWPASGIWWLDILEIPWGFGVILSAFTLRFIIRRLPWIG